MPFFYIPTRRHHQHGAPHCQKGRIGFPSKTYLASLTEQELRHRISETKEQLAIAITRYDRLDRHLGEQLSRVQRMKDALRAQDQVVEQARDTKEAYVGEKMSRDDERERARRGKACGGVAAGTGAGRAGEGGEKRRGMR